MRERERYWTHLLRCERKTSWWDVIFEKEFRNTDAEAGIRRTVGCKNNGQSHRVGIYMIRSEDKRERQGHVNKFR
jgi:hypothetical protein